MKVKLNEEQNKLKEQIKMLYSEVISDLSKKNIEVSYEVLGEKIRKMGEKSHQLHIQLEPEPKHQKHLVQKSLSKPNDLNFYFQVQAVQDLLNYLDDSTANDDPIDNTLGDTFFFKIYNRREGYQNLYELTRNEHGWYVSHLMHEGQAGKNAEPVLSYILRYEDISYPRNLSDIIEEIWMRAEKEGLTKKEVQTMLNKVADWIEVIEKNYPEGIVR